jgi:septal ring factor EnvC (AmiA/AmiB activator)
MTNAEQPQDITQRLANIDEQLEQIGDELDLIRTIQNGVRRETRINSQTAGRLERTVAQLGNIARDHQLALRLTSENAERDTALAVAKGIALYSKLRFVVYGSIFYNKVVMVTRQVTSM